MSKQLVSKNAACLGSKMVEECRTGCWTALSSRSKSLRSTSTVELGSSQFLASGVKGARLLRKLKGWQGLAVEKGFVCVGVWGCRGRAKNTGNEGFNKPRTSRICQHLQLRCQLTQYIARSIAPWQMCESGDAGSITPLRFCTA